MNTTRNDKGYLIASWAHVYIHLSILYVYDVVRVSQCVCELVWPFPFQHLLLVLTALKYQDILYCATVPQQFFFASHRQRGGFALSLSVFSFSCHHNFLSQTYICMHLVFILKNFVQQYCLANIKWRYIFGHRLWYSSLVVAFDRSSWTLTVKNEKWGSTVESGSNLVSNTHYVHTVVHKMIIKKIAPILSQHFCVCVWFVSIFMHRGRTGTISRKQNECDKSVSKNYHSGNKKNERQQRRIQAWFWTRITDLKKSCACCIAY